MRILMKTEFYTGKLTLPDNELVVAVVAELKRQEKDRYPLHHAGLAVLSDDDSEHREFLQGAKFGSGGSVMWLPDELIPKVRTALGGEVNDGQR